MNSDVTWHKADSDDGFILLIEAKNKHCDLLVDTTVTMRIVNAGYVDPVTLISSEVGEKILRFAIIG